MPSVLVIIPLTNIHLRRHFRKGAEKCLVLIKCPSCTAANVAIDATMAMGITDQNTAGAARKRRNPVSLLANV
jgi:hypothetical protein